MCGEHSQAGRACTLKETVPCRYMMSRGHSGDNACQRPALQKSLAGFAIWAIANAMPGGELSAAEVSMCTDIWRPVNFHDRATIKGVTFTSERLQRNSKLKSCVVISKMEWADPANGPVRVGIVQRFFTYRPSWAGADDGCLLNVADVKWMKPYKCNEELDGGPVISKSMVWHLMQGDLVRVEDIIPTHVCLVPHLNSSWANRWQVLHTECHFTTKQY